jgi:predicted metal-dependent hydrolase
MARTRKPVVEVRRSQRRRRTVSAYRDGERVVVLIPDRFSRAEETEWVERMLARLSAREERIRRTDDELLARARRLTTRYLPDYAVHVAPTSVRWVTNQNGRWGSCTPDDGTIRISDRIQEMPDWVVDYVLLHELAHLLEPSHNPRFWTLLQSYPRLERARGYLEGVAAAAELDMEPLGESDVPSELPRPAHVLPETEVAAKFSGDNPPEQPTLL